MLSLPFCTFSMQKQDIPGPSSGPSTHRLSCSLPSPPSQCAWPCSRWSPLVAVLLLQPFCAGPSHSSISAGLILNIDFGSAATSLLCAWLAPRTQAKARSRETHCQGKNIEHTQSSFAVSLGLNFHVDPDDYTRNLAPIAQNFTDSSIPMKRIWQLSLLG